MTANRSDLPANPIWPTVLILIFYATAAALVGVFVTFLAATVSIGPFAWLMYGAAIIATYIMAAITCLIVTPIWALLAGTFFTYRASGNVGSAAASMNVTLFSDTHEIAIETQRLATQMGLPGIAYIGWFSNEEINAFAMGTSPANALIAVSRGAVERLTKAELSAVLAHELGHVVSNDMARMTYARGIQEGLTFFLIFRGLKQLARWVFTPLSEIEILRLSRAREFTADKISAMTIGAGNMVAALEKLLHEKEPTRTRGYGNVLMWSGFGGGSLFSTHPPLEQRIARLKELQERFHQSTEAAVLPMPASAQ